MASPALAATSVPATAVHGARSLDTRLGTCNLKIPKLRTGAYFPDFLEPRKTAEKALVSVIQEAWIAGISTRRVDELVQAMGTSGISNSSVSKLCKDIDERVNKEVKRRADVVGIFPNQDSITRLIGAVLLEQNHEYQPPVPLHAARRHDGARNTPIEEIAPLQIKPKAA